MKKLFRKSLVMAVMLAATVSYANEFKDFNNEIGEVTNVSFKNVSEGSILTIKDVNGIILYKETIKSRGTYSKEFDLTALPDGNYLFELDKEFEIKLIPFKVINTEVIFDKEKGSVILKPTVLEKEALVKIQVSNLSGKPVKIEIYYMNGELVYNRKYEETQILSEIFDFSTSLKGEYKIFIKTEDRTFIEDIKI